MANNQIQGNVVLVIDDDDINLQVAKLILEKKLPCRVITANNGYDGLEILRRQYVRVVLLDIMMPDFDGMEVLKEIRADNKLKNIPVMMLTASVDKENIQQAIKFNVKDYIRKPFLPEELISRVEKKLVIKKDVNVAKILIIDDNENNLKSLRRVLENHFPHEVLTADSGIDGLEILNETEINLVIAGTGMRLINGFRILDFIKKDSKLKKIRMILVANEEDTETLAKIKMTDAEGAITFPFDEEKIISVVTETLKNKIQGYSNFSGESNFNFSV